MRSPTLRGIARADSITIDLHNRRELDIAVARLLFRGFRLHDLLLVEYCDTRSGDGLFRKYAASKIGDRIVPRHILFSRRWVLKKPDLTSSDMVEEESRYLSENPHEGFIRDTCMIAHVEYGRIDYSFLDEAPQTWEINTNPTVVGPKRDPDHASPELRRFVGDLWEALSRLETPGEGTIMLANSTVEKLKQTRRTKRRPRKGLVRVCGNYPSAFWPLGRAARLSLSLPRIVRGSAGRKG